MSDILADRADEAFAAILIPVFRSAFNLPSNTPVNVFTRRNSGTRVIPYIEIATEIGEEDTFRSGNFWCTATISINYRAAQQPGQSTNPKDNSQALISAVNEKLSEEDLESQLSGAVTDFHVFETSIQRMGMPGDYERVDWLDQRQFRFLACASSLS